MQVSQHSPGRFCWAELTTTDRSAAEAFYGAIFGWTTFDLPIGPDDVYTMFNLNGQNAAAMYEDKSGTRPVCWGSYITTENADSTASKITALGGTIMAGPFDVMEAGRMAVAVDPTGAVFQIWEPKAHIGYTVTDEVGAVCWNELNIRDADKAGAFYSGVFGYGIKKSEHPMAYFEYQLEGKSVAGMMEMTPDMEGVPPHWLIYFTVADCNATAKLAVELGARTLYGPMVVEGVGTIAGFMDAQGAVFGVISA